MGLGLLRSSHSAGPHPEPALSQALPPASLPPCQPVSRPPRGSGGLGGVSWRWVAIVIVSSSTLHWALIKIK